MKIFSKSIVAILLSISLILSAAGINMSVYTCESANTSDVSLIFDNLYSDFKAAECPRCTFDNHKHMHKHALNTETVASECSEEQIPDNLPSNEEGNCCFELFEFIQAKFELAIITEVDLSVLSLVLYAVEADFFRLDYSTEKPNKVLSHHSGISPPYISTYIYFIASILE